MGKKKEKKVYGVGVNDSPEPVQRFEKVDGKKKQVWVCPYYVVWKDMLKRCYYEPYLKKNPKAATIGSTALSALYHSLKLAHTTP